MGLFTKKEREPRCFLNIYANGSNIISLQLKISVVEEILENVKTALNEKKATIEIKTEYDEATGELPVQATINTATITAAIITLEE
jgi:hypothetical protein